MLEKAGTGLEILRMGELHRQWERETSGLNGYIPAGENGCLKWAVVACC